MANVRLRPRSGGFAEWFSYRLDRFLALHPVIQLFAVLVWATFLAFVFGTLSLFFANDPQSEQDGGFWWAVTHMLDGGTVAGDQGLLRRFVGIAVTLLGMVLVAVVTGAFASSFADRLREIRRGTFHIFERRHVLLLGYGARGDIVLRELAMSGVRLTVVIVTSRERDVVEESVRDALAGAHHRLNVIVRRADPTTAGGVRGAAARHARAVAVLPEVEHESAAPLAAAPSLAYVSEDRAAMRSMLAARRAIGSRRVPVIVEISGDRGRDLIALCGKGSDVTVVEDGDVSTHLLVHAVRQPGVLDVVRQILSLDARSVYMHKPGAFVGKTFDEAHARITPGILIGLLRNRGTMLCPAGGTRIDSADRLLVFADDDSEPSPAARLPATPDDRSPLPRRFSKDPIHVLIVGYGRSLPQILAMLREHCVARVTLLVAPEHAAAARGAIALSGFPAGDATLFEGRAGDAGALSRAVSTLPTRLLLLADAAASVAEDADADQLVTLLSLRRRLAELRPDLPAVVEIRSAETERLIGSDHQTDFVLSREVVGMLVAQELHAICLDDTAGAWLGEVFRTMLNEICTRIWLRPLALYLPGIERPAFADVLAMARRRGEIAIGVHRPRARAALLPEREERFEAKGAHVVVIAAPEPAHALPEGERHLDELREPRGD